MYFLALLFFLGCIFNLFFGDLDEAVWGLAISIVLSAGTYFWVMEDEKFTNRIRLPIIITVVIFGGAFGLTKALEEIEINAEKYVLVTKIRNSFPETAQLIQIGMEDKKISIDRKSVV